MTDHRQLGVDLFNHVWTLLDAPERTREQDDDLLHAAHASRHHWGQAVGAGPEHLARGEWQISRVYVVLGRPEPALHHAHRCLEHCDEHAIDDWDLAYAHEALARAHALAGSEEEAARHKHLARVAGDAIADADDREQFEADWDTL